MPGQGDQATQHTAPEWTPSAGGEDASGAARPGFALSILHHPDAARLGDRALLRGLELGVEAALAREFPVFEAVQGGVARPLGLASVSRQAVQLMGLPGGGLRIAAAERSRLAVGGVPLVGCLDLPPERLAEGLVLRLGQSVLLLLHRAGPLQRPPPGDPLLGVSDGVAQLRRLAASLGATEVPVLLRGETGVGKELVARALHRASPRRAAPFVAINMGAIPETVAAAELFGVGRGAFTGATDARTGFFGAAEGGTLFLDEVGTTPLAIQALLLRALDDGVVQPVGSAARPTDVRIVAATDADLEAQVAEGSFRAPLLHRLAVGELWLPPLRARREDIPILLRAFGSAAAGEPSLALVEALVQRPWPGNIRELRNAATRMGLLGELRLEAAAGGSAGHRSMLALPGEGPTRTAELPLPPAPAAPPPAVAAPPDAPQPRAPGRALWQDDDTLRAALRAHGWEVAPTARALRVAKNTLVARLRTLPGHRAAQELGAEELEALLRRFDRRIPAVAEHLEVSERALRQRLRRLGLAP